MFYIDREFLTVVLLLLVCIYLILDLPRLRKKRTPLPFILVFEKFPINRCLLAPLSRYKENIMSFTLSQDYMTLAEIHGFRRDGTEAPLENIEFSVDTDPADPLGPVVEIAPTDNTCLITPVRVGTVQFKVTADARIGDGVSLLTGLATIDVVPGEAVSLSIQFGDLIPRT
jgi:hypothetical protein